MKTRVFITGTNRGLGLALVRRFLDTGAQVFAGVRTNDKELDALAAAHASRLSIVTLDVASIDSVRAAAQTVARSTDALDILINNAAVRFEPPTTLEQLDLAAYPMLQTMDVNAFGPLRVTQQFLPLLERGRRKTIVNISSEAGSIAGCWRDSEFAYGMSKAALNMQTRLLANHLRPRGFRVFAVQPGWMRTDMGGSQAPLDPDESARGIVALATQGAIEHGFVDYLGKPLEW